jgi:hypothetical protein
MTELASNYGDINEDLMLLGLKWALTLKWNALTLQIQLGKLSKNVHAIKNIYPADFSSELCATPVDPAGPHCYRDRTKTCKSSAF